MTPERFVARVSVWRTGGIALACAGLAALGGYMWVLPEPGVRWIGVGIAAVFGLFAIGCVRQLLRTEPVIEIGPEGVQWRRWSDQRVPWSAITRAAVRRVRYQRFVCLWLADPSAYPPARRLGKFSRANKALGFGDLPLATGGLDRRTDELVAAIAVYLPVER